MDHKYRLSRSLRKALADFVEFAVTQSKIVVRAASSLPAATLQAYAHRLWREMCLQVQSCCIQLPAMNNLTFLLVLHHSRKSLHHGSFHSVAAVAGCPQGLCTFHLLMEAAA